MGREDVHSTLKLIMISDGNENQFLIFLIFIYLIDPDFITLYRKKNFEILTSLTQTQFWDELAKSHSFSLFRIQWMNFIRFFDLSVIS